jgi:hypothetical protein
VKRVKKITVAVLALVLLMVCAAIAPVFAKNTHLPAGASDIVYMNGEGSAIVDIPSGSTTPTATKMLIGVHIDEAPAKYVGDRLYIELWEIMPGATDYSWQPWLEVLTNPNMAELIRDFWAGSAAEFNIAAAIYYLVGAGFTPEEAAVMAPFLTTDNVFLVGDNELTVARHGDHILVNLATPQQIKIPMTIADYWTLPAFSMKLHAYGESVHKEPTFVMSGWPGAWGGTLAVKEMGFNANGAFTCSAWSLDKAPMSEGWITMHGTQTFYPPLVNSLTDHVNAYGSTVIDIEDHPNIVFDGYHIDSGSLGSGDVIRIWRYAVVAGNPLYLPVAIFTDSVRRLSLFHELYVPPYLPTSIQLVDPCAIEIHREHHSKTVMVEWKTALEVPEETWGPPGFQTVVPAMTIPPGHIIFRGTCEAYSDSSSSSPTYPGQVWSQTITWTGYYGHATLVCPTWHFRGPVGVDEGAYRTSIRTDATIISTKP